MTYSNESDNRPLPASPLERTFLTGGRHTADDFPDPFADHDIECWVWDGERLVPASGLEIQDFEEWERSRAAMRQLTRWEREEWRRARSWRTRAIAGLRILARLPRGERAPGALAATGDTSTQTAPSPAPENNP